MKTTRQNFDFVLTAPRAQQLLRLAQSESLQSTATSSSIYTGMKLLLIQRWFSLTDDELLAEVEDRLALLRFCGLTSDDPLPERGSLAEARAHLAQHDNAQEAFEEVVQQGYDVLRKHRPVISIVSPVYRAEAVVMELVQRICQHVAPVTENFEIVLVDDGSPDRSWSSIEECCRADSRIRGIKLSRNFGQHPAITAGLAHAHGDWIVVIDCDLQDNPKYIPKLYEKALEGFDIVYTVKEKREHGFFKNALAHLFSRVSNWLSSTDKADPRIGAYSIISRRVMKAFLRLQDVHRHYLMLVRWLGFRSSTIPIRHEPRFEGRTSYSFMALLRHAVNGIVSHSDRLLYLSVGLGLTVFFFSMLGALYLVLAYYHTGFKEGWTSTMVLILLTTSMILFSIGVAGIYIGKTFEQVKHRPLYLVDKIRNPSPQSPEVTTWKN